MCQQAEKPRLHKYRPSIGANVDASNIAVSSVVAELRVESFHLIEGRLACRSQSPFIVTMREYFKLGTHCDTGGSCFCQLNLPPLAQRPI